MLGRDSGARWAGRLSVALATIVAVTAFHAGYSPAGAATTESAVSSDLDALVLGRAGSPALRAMRDIADLDLVRRSKVARLRPRRYDMVVVDGDHLTRGELRRHPALKRFVGANKWVAAFDVRPSDHEALDTYTGFDVADGERSDRSEMFLFRVSRVEGTPTVEMIDSGPYSRPGTARLGDRREAKLSRSHVRRVARLVDRHIGTGGARVASRQNVACEALNPPPDPELQHVGFCYVDAGQKPAPTGRWTEKSNPGWAEWWKGSHAPGRQTATWTMNHRFDVFLNSDPNHTSGTFQTVTYELNGQFNPKRASENFFRMDRPEDWMYTGWGAPPGGGPWKVERAWWTGQIASEVTPSIKTDEKLGWLKSHPESPNAETSYSAGEEFSIGFNGTAGNLTNVAGGGISLSYGVSNVKSYSIPDWGVENKGSGNRLHWIFSARQPCDTRKAAVNPADCFEAYHTAKKPCPASPYLSECFPSEPKPLSQGQVQVKTFGSWRTNKHLDTSNGPLTFTVSTPVQIVDTYCEAVWHVWCDPIGRVAPPKYRSERTGPDAEDVTIDASVVNPIPIKELKLLPNPANGARDEKVTGTVVLERPARIPVTVKLYSDSDNAKVGAPLPGVGGGSQSTVTIDPGKSSGTFTVATNDNKLQAGGHTTATITAFYAQATSGQLKIERRKP